MAIGVDQNGGGGGGAGGIAGTITQGQVAFGATAADTIAGNDLLYWSNTRENLSVGPGHSIVTSPYSFTAGAANTLASGAQPSFAFGVTNQVNYAWACAIGYGNLVNYQACFAAGQANGILGASQCGIALGYSNTVNTNVLGSVALGSQVFLGASAIFGLGSGLTISGVGAFGLGTGLIVTGDHSGGVNLDGVARTIANNNVFSILGGNTGIGTVAPLTTLHVNGSLTAKAVTVTTNTYSVLSTDYYIGVNNAAATAINLPSSATAGNGRIIKVKDESGAAGANNITVQANGAELIDGSNTYVISTNYGSVELICRGTYWSIIN